MNLIDQIEEKRREIHTDAYPMSIGELINLYSEDELDIHPEFQRLYRWTETQKSRLIESILLGIPLPSFFVAQRDDGVWDVVDGLQRLSTIFSFLGIYKNDKNEIEPALVLSGTDYLPSLDGVGWDETINPDNHFSIELQRAFKREKVDLKIIKKESDDQTKYDLFQRLNTFGSSLSAQEVRNCLLIMIDRTFYEWLTSLADNVHFKNTLTITGRQYDEQYHLELVSRFLVLRNADIQKLRSVPDISEFVTEEIKTIALDTEFDRSAVKTVFEKTFQIIDHALGDNAFRKYQNDKYSGGFSLSIYELIAIGLGSNIDSYNLESQSDKEKINLISTTLQNNTRYTSKSGSGYKASDRLPHILPLGVELFTK